MNLPYPFKSARGLEPDALGRIALIDEGGRVLAHLPLTTAHGIAPEEGWSFGSYADSGDGYGFGSGYGFGFSSGEGRGK
jgi:hypothetical protein